MLENYGYEVIDLGKDVPIEENYIENCKEYAKEILDVSNDIIVYNYFRKELSEERFEKE